MNPTKNLKREVVAFFAITIALTTAMSVAVPHGEITLVASMLFPTVAVAIVTFTLVPRGERRELWRGFGLRRAGLRTWPAAFVVPTLLCAGAYGIVLLIGKGHLELGPVLDGPASGGAVPVLIGLAVSTLFCLGEEIGWRGFMLPRMQQLLGDRRRAAVATGFAHGCFHLPLILIGTVYDNEVPRWVAAPMMLAVVTAGGVFYAWIWDRSHSAWPVAVAHNVVNTVFDFASAAVVATGGVNIAYFGGETGFATLAACVVLAVVLWRSARVWRRPAVRTEPAPVVTLAA